MNLRNSFAILFVFVSYLLSNTNSIYRVAGGSDWEIQVSPYLVSIRYNGSHRCMGALISLKSVLTSGICMAGIEESQISILAGTSNLHQGKAIRYVALIIRPCNLDMEDMDLAMIILKKTLYKSKTIEEISLCDINLPLTPGLKLRVSGWGSKDANVKQPSYYLQSSGFQVYPRDHCAALYAAAGRYLLETEICVLGQDTFTCWGDTGAPAVVDGKLCAVVGDGIKNYPTIYTSINNPNVRAFIAASIKV